MRRKLHCLIRKKRKWNPFKTDVENRKSEITSMREKLDEALMFISAERIDLDSDIVVF